MSWPEILDNKQKNSVKSLADITKAIYIMQWRGTPNYYRFGAIGVKGNDNTAIKRLGQCVYRDSNGLNTWEYLEIAKFRQDTKTEVIRCAESALKSKLVGNDGFFRNEKTQRWDAIRTENSSKLSSLFKEVVNSLVMDNLR